LVYLRNTVSVSY